MAELVEGARLEIVFAGNRNKGSNPFLSAKHKSPISLGKWAFLLLEYQSLPLILPLIELRALNLIHKSFHSGGAIMLHFLAHMAINIERK